MNDARPTIRLKPKTDPRRIRRGFPWVYDNELVTDRRTKALLPGTIATLEDGDRQPLATVTINPNSKIIGRILSRNPAEAINTEWIKRKLQSALILRQSLYDTPFYRLVHAEADGLPGVIIDRFGEAVVIQPNAAWAENMFEQIAKAIGNITGATTIIKNAGGRARSLEGLEEDSQIVTGTLSGPVEVPMNGATYLADLVGGQKTGLFYDQRPNHAFVSRLAKDTDVLDVFSHVGGFGLAALAAGAKSAICVDGSKAALELAEQGAKATGVAERFEARQGDAFDMLAEFDANGQMFGTVVCDPPAFAPSKSALSAGLRAYEKVAKLSAPLVETGGTLTLCSCSHAADLSQFRKACLSGIGRAGRQAQILRTGFAGPDHPQHSALSESGYLKAITFRMIE